MEPIRIKIKDTEAAGIEIVPVEDGVEIIIRKDSKVSAPKEGKAACKNADILKDFCSEKKAEYEGNKKMRGELLRFFNFYSAKVCDWKGAIQPEKLWKSWEEKIK